MLRFLNLHLVENLNHPTQPGTYHFPTNPLHIATAQSFHSLKQPKLEIHITIILAPKPLRKNPTYRQHKHQSHGNKIVVAELTAAIYPVTRQWYGSISTWNNSILYMKCSTCPLRVGCKFVIELISSLDTNC